MEALYGDLENYNEVNIVEELRTENRDLKLKLEEYETAIGKLQKSLLQDYDKLVLEFNNLQTNYSSLLKTARAEVERKAQMITQLNIEKDMMILNKLQNANNRRFQNKLQNNTQNQKKTTRGETEKANGKSDSISKRELKENVAVQNPKTHASSIKTRRKSTPSSSMLHLTTNEDQESDKPMNQKLKDTLPKEICGTSDINERLTRISSEGLSNKPSDTSSLSGRSSNYQELTGDGNRSATSKHFDCEQFKRDKIRESERNTDKIDEYREGDKIRENYSNRKDDKILDIRRIREGEKYSDGNKFQEGYKCKEDNKFRDSLKYRDGDKFREPEKFRDGDKFREAEKFRDGDKFRDAEKFRDGDKFRDAEKFRDGDKFRDAEKFRDGDKFREAEKFKESESVREGEKLNDHDKYGESENKNRQSNKYRMRDKSRESDRYKESEKYRESDRFRESDRYRETDRYRDNDRYRIIDKSDKFKEDDKYLHTDKFRNRDKFDPSYRYKRHHSPDRPYKRNYRDCEDDYKQEHGRHRVLGSSTPESHSLSHARSHDKQLFYEGQRHKSENYKQSHESRHGERLSLSDNQDEPCKKRQKFEYEIHVAENRQRHEREPLIKPSCSMDYDMLAASCESPDAVFSPDSYTDVQTGHTIKEIKNTASTPLEDPRIISKRYVLKTENGTTTLSTAASKCIDIKPVDKSLWNIQSVAVPDALLKEPQSHIAEECIKEIYMDIDNPESNVSVETGEIIDDTISSCGDQDKDPEKRLEVNDINNIAADVVSTLKNKAENVQKITTPILDEIPINQQVEILDVPKDLPKIICDENLTKKIVKDNKYSATLQSNLPQFDEHAVSAPDIHMSKNRRDQHNQISSSEMAMVQDDLELSDETSDNLDYHKHIVIEKEILPKEQSTLVSKKDNDLNNESKYSFKITPEANVETVNIAPNENLKEFEGHRKQRSKKRKTKSKEKDVDEKNNEIHVTEKKIKSKKDKECKPKQIKNKFTDLFGDSSSLITPADLGIPSDCVPLCEDAQDAVDINIKEVVAPQSCENNLILNETIPKNDRGNTSINDKEIAKSIEEHDGSSSSNVDANIIYQNLNAEVDLNKPDIVKTVIISSGVQPQFILESEENSENRGENVDLKNVNFHQVAADMEFKKQTSLKALATSTPHKELPINNTMGSECVNIPSDSKSGGIDTNELVVNQSNINTKESLDTPDVRIFVRRRKKGVKKP